MFRDVNHLNRCLLAGIAVLLAGTSSSGFLISRLEAQPTAATSPLPSPDPPKSSLHYRPERGSQDRKRVPLDDLGGLTY